MEDKPKKRLGRPKGTTKNRYPGMIREKKPKIGSAKKKDDKYQAETKAEFMKVREGETVEQWKKRTGRKRFSTQGSNKIRALKKGRVYSYANKMKGKDKLVCNAIRTRFAEKPYDFMKVYAIILRWASVKHNILKDDLEIGYYFYTGYHFSFKEFNDLCIQLGTVRGVFSRFKKKGYIVSINVEIDGQLRESGFFVLSVEFSNIIKSIYGALTKTVPLTIFRGKRDGRELPADLLSMIEKMNADIEETITGLKKAEEVRFRNE